MSEKPILFSAPMVRAILDGRKTQTRRVIEPAPKGEAQAGDILVMWGEGFVKNASRFRPKYCVGGHLWVREAWRTESHAYDDLAPSDMDADYTVIYEADAEWKHNRTVGRLRPGIHMPRWASRITLEVTGVKVERLQDISEEDAKAEGCGLFVPGHGFITMDELRADPGYSNYLSPRQGFEAIWTEINGAESWNTNPWVVAISFKRLAP